MDTIHIQDLKISTHIGVPDSERTTQQTLHVSLWLQTDARIAAKSDDINDTIDYAAVVLCVQEIGKTERKTIERFAEDCADAILKQFSPKSVTISVQKFILPETKSIALTISRP